MPPLFEHFLPIVAILGTVLFLLTLLKLLLATKPAGRIKYPYQAIPCLFTKAERSFLGVLEQTLSPHYRVFGKVRVADVIEVAKGTTRSEHQKAFNRISSKHFDFVICRASDTSISLLIELDDSSHANRKRQERDAFLEKATEAAGIKLLRIPCKKSYSTKELGSLLAANLPESEGRSQ